MSGIKVYLTSKYKRHQGICDIEIYVTNTANATFVSAFVLPRIDYSNTLVVRIQIYAARVILRVPKSPNIIAHHFFGFLSKQEAHT